MGLQRLPQQIQLRGRVLGELVQKQDSHMRQGDQARDRYVSAPYECSLCHGVVRRDKRSLRDKSLLFRQPSRHTVDPGDFEGLLRRERRHDPGKASCQHTLSGPGRPDHEHVVKACRRDLQHFFGLALPVDISEIRVVLFAVPREQVSRVHLHGRQKEVPLLRIPAEVIDQLRQRAHADHADPVHERALREISARDQTGGDPPLLGLDNHGQDPLDRPDLPVEPHLSRDQNAVRGFFLYISEADQEPDTDGDVDHDPPLGYSRGGQVDGDPSGRKMDPQVSQRNADALARLSHFAAHKPDHIERGKTV